MAVGPEKLHSPNPVSASEGSDGHAIVVVDPEQVAGCTVNIKYAWRQPGVSMTWFDILAQSGMRLQGERGGRA